MNKNKKECLVKSDCIILSIAELSKTQSGRKENIPTKLSDPVLLHDENELVPSNILLPLHTCHKPIENITYLQLFYFF